MLAKEQINFAIDHRYIKEVDIESLLILAAEIKRCRSKKTINLSYSKKYAPRCQNIARLLNSVGYWEHFNVSGKKLKENPKKKYLKITDGTKCDYNEYLKIREFFDTNLNFLDNNLELRDIFDDAITEAIANSVEHAYIRKQRIYTIDNHWWLCGYYDKEKKDLYFVCFDQGIGLKRSLYYNDSRTISKWYESAKSKKNSYSDIIKSLVNDELPKYQNSDRGYGFKRFKKFIDSFGNGSLSIYSRTGYYAYFNEKNVTTKEILNDYSSILNGTLIAWKINLKEISR